MLATLLPGFAVSVVGGGGAGRVVVASPLIAGAPRASRLVARIVASVLESLGFKPLGVEEGHGVVAAAYRGGRG